jgi:hypothetical protein
MREHWTERWWVHGLMGLFMVFSSLFIWIQLADWEKNPHDRANPLANNWYSPFALAIYWVGGKSLMASLFVLVAAFMLCSSLDRFHEAFRTDRGANGLYALDFEPEFQPYRIQDLSPRITSRGDFLVNVLGRVPLEPFEFQTTAMQRMWSAIDEIGFTQFHGHEYEVLMQLDFALEPHRRTLDTRWARIYIANALGAGFGGTQGAMWHDLIRADRANVRHAIEAAFWNWREYEYVTGPALSSLFTLTESWPAAHAVIAHAAEPIRAWWGDQVELLSLGDAERGYLMQVG